MEVINETEVHSFAQKHSSARKPLGNWIDVTKTADWKSFPDVRETFRSADYVKEQVVFDIGGNNYRLISSIDYETQHVYVLEVRRMQNMIGGRREHSKGRQSIHGANQRVSSDSDTRQV